MISQIDQSAYTTALKNAQQALLKGDRRSARRYAEQAAKHNPDKEDPWLILAAVGSPNASIGYLQHALEINPNSERAKKGMLWAQARLGESAKSQELHPIPPVLPRKIVPESIPSNQMVKPRQVFWPWLLLFIVVLAGLTFWFAFPNIAKPSQNKDLPNYIAQVVEKATRTPTATNTSTPLPTSTATPVPTDTPTQAPTNTPTLAPTDTPVPTPTATAKPKAVKKKKKTQYSYTGPDGFVMPNVGSNEHWVDVDLSQQRSYAYEGDRIVASFIVSTGTWLHPTVTGKYRIYVKYRYADMSGPGYYLPDVPYIMYFYKGYGLHGTYWHNNFGTPMSHGCVNFRTSDAQWLFNFASVGTLVNVHH